MVDLKKLEAGDSIRLLGHWFTTAEVNHSKESVKIKLVDYNSSIIRDYKLLGREFENMKSLFDIQEIRKASQTASSLKTSGKLESGMCFKDYDGNEFYFVAEDPTSKIHGIFTPDVDDIGDVQIHNLSVLTLVKGKERPW